jgi:hypothetical protein
LLTFRKWRNFDSSKIRHTSLSGSLRRGRRRDKSSSKHYNSVRIPSEMREGSSRKCLRAGKISRSSNQLTNRPYLSS